MQSCDDYLLSNAFAMALREKDVSTSALPKVGPEIIYRIYASFGGVEGVSKEFVIGTYVRRSFSPVRTFFGVGQRDR